jgi:hypothetical protein
MQPRRPSFARVSFGLALVSTLVALVTLLGPGTGAATATAVGEVGPGHTAFTFVGRIEQNGTLADDFGYLTSIDGLDEAVLFSGSDSLSRNGSTARFTYFATATLQTRSINGNLFVTAGTARTTLYFSEAGGANFDEPASFKHGQAAATYESHWQDIVNVQAPSRGIATVVSNETQTSATPFTLAGTQYTLGHEGLLLRLAFTGQGTRTDPTAPRATILYAGEAVALSAASASAGTIAVTKTSTWTWVALALSILALLIAVVAAGRRAAGRTGG